MKYCENCGTELTDGAKFCPNCGNTIRENNVNVTLQSDSNGNEMTKAQKGGAGCLTVFIAISGLTLLIQGNIIPGVAAIAAVVALVYLQMGKINKKYAWTVMIAAFIGFVVIGAATTEDKPSKKQTITTQKEATESERQAKQQEEAERQAKQQEEAERQAREQEKAEQEAREKEEQNAQMSKRDEIRKLGFDDGVKFGYSDRGNALRQYVQMGETLENGLRHIQNVVAKVAYKQDYGDNISDELLDEYAHQFIEGYKSIVIKK